ncbi:MAG: immunoglobulin domain-containing protein [Verrucomicrobiota bacterium]
MQYYRERGGNPAGVEVVHLALNLQADTATDRTRTDQFIRTFNIELVANDTSRVLARRFQSSGQPIFAIINGVANSPSHRQWELLLNQNGYGSVDHPIELFRSLIDSVKAAPAAEPPVITQPPQPQTVETGARVEFKVTATGTPPLSFEWLKNGEPISGATGDTFVIASATVQDNGEYRVRVSNAAQTVTSDPARLTVLAPEVAPRLDRGRFLANGVFEFKFRGQSGRRYRVEVSDTLGQWQPLRELEGADQDTLIQDENAGKNVRRFYRAVRP